jgi:hypothetical protein
MRYLCLLAIGFLNEVVNAHIRPESGDELGSYFTLIPDGNSWNSDGDTLISESEIPGEESCGSEVIRSGFEESGGTSDLWASDLGADSGSSTGVGEIDGASELWNLDSGLISETSNTLAPSDISLNPVNLDALTEPQLSSNAVDSLADLTASEGPLFPSDLLGSGGQLAEHSVPLLAKRTQTDFCLLSGTERRTRKKKPPMPMPETDRTKVGKDGCYEGWEAFCCPYYIPVLGTADCHHCGFSLSFPRLLISSLPFAELNLQIGRDGHFVEI